MKTNTRKLNSKSESNSIDASITYRNMISNAAKAVQEKREKNVTSSTYINVNTSLNDIKTRLKTAKNEHSSPIIIGKGMKKLQRELRLSEESGLRNISLRNDLRELFKIRRDIKKIATT